MTTRTPLTVGYFDIDKMGIAHHSNYLKWFEAGRRDYLRKAGVSSSRINELGFYLPLSGMECKFKSPVRYHDELYVITEVTFLSCVKIEFRYKVMNRLSGKLMAQGRTVHVWTNESIEPLNIEKEAPQIHAALKQFSEL